MVRTRPGRRPAEDRRTRRAAATSSSRRPRSSAPAFTRVAQELHSQYLLGFSPKNLDGKVHKLEVRSKNVGNKARARRSYVGHRRQPAPPGGK